MTQLSTTEPATGDHAATRAVGHATARTSADHGFADHTGARAARRTAARGGFPAARRLQRVTTTSEAGMATAEYAIATLAACGFAGLLVAILSGGEVRGLLLAIIQRALDLG
ncbi:DUF4244 domain-containing protein [Thalassiella azotivora]